MPPPRYQVLKPAIYLYPEETTEVKVLIDPRVKLTIDIPKYSAERGWNVIAKPDGTLHDLQPELSDSNELKKYIDQIGLEYAYVASLRGIYPYLYWEGIAAEDYDYNGEGWLVTAMGIDTFLQSKLQDMGLNEVESNDFLSYWTVKIAQQQKPYYKLSFMFTEAFNTAHPMIISPKPDSIFRVMLRVEPLDKLPHEQPQKQKIERIERKGFFVLEWGGYFAGIKSKYSDGMVLSQAQRKQQ